jgi:adenylate kinase
LGIQIEHVIHLTVSAEAVTERLGGRRSCPACGAMFHVAFAKPAKEGICDSCGGGLIQRKDDNPTTILERLSVYEEKTAPLVSYYGDKGILKTVSGEGDTDDITRGITQILAG